MFLRESWQHSNNDCTNIKLRGYECIALGKSCSTKGGLIIYFLERFKYTIKLTINKSKIWEGQFINVTGGGLSKHVILGNMYIPSRDINEKYKTFIEELKQVISIIGNNNTNVIIAETQTLTY